MAENFSDEILLHIINAAYANEIRIHKYLFWSIIRISKSNISVMTSFSRRLHITAGFIDNTEFLTQSRDGVMSYKFNSFII